MNQRRSNFEMGTTELFHTVRRMTRQSCSDDTIHNFIEKVITARVNAERAELVAALMEAEVDTGDNDILTASRAGNVVEAVVAFTRKMLIKVVRERIEKVDE